MSGHFNIAEEGHVVVGIYPIDVAGGATTDCFSMRDWAHVSIIVCYGATADATTSIVVKECASKAGGGNAIAYDVYKCETTGAAADCDVLGVRVPAATVTSAGINPADTNNIFYLIEIDAAQLTAGYEWLEVVLLNAAANVNLATVIAIFSGGRYEGVSSRTVLDN
jgi:hypothetical protein